MDETTLRDWTAWPGVDAAPKWGDDLVFTVADKMFCVLCVRGADAGSMSFKVEDERFLEFTDRPGFEPAPYLARARWVRVADPSGVAPGELRALVRRSYELVRAKLPKKTRHALAD